MIGSVCKFRLDTNILSSEHDAVIPVEVFVSLRMITNLFRWNELLIQSQASINVRLLQTISFDVHSKSNFLLEIRNKKNDIIDEPLKLSFGNLQLLRKEVLGVSLIDSNWIELYLFIYFTRNVDTICL